MKALLDTNIIIYRETHRVLNRDIGILFKWLDKGKYTKCVHQITLEEIRKNSNKDTVDTFNVKLDSYEALQTTAPLSATVKTLSDAIDKNANDTNDSRLLNEVVCDRVDIFITEDKQIHKKAAMLGISDRVFNIDSFLEKVVSEHPELVNYSVLSVTKKRFGELSLDDPFFDSFREDYVDFNKWFNKKSEEIAYVTHNMGKILSFLFLKIEGKDENYSDITPAFSSKKRLKIGTFKVLSNGVRLGERFLKIIFDNAIRAKAEEIYCTIYNKRDEQKRLIGLLEEWGFVLHGQKTGKNGNELVYVRNFSPKFSAENPKTTYPYFSKKTSIYLTPIYPQYHTDLLPDSILTTESPYNFIENEPHRNAISKVYVSQSIERDLRPSDLIVFYRTGGKYLSVTTTIGIVESVITDIKDENDFILKNRKRSVFTNEELKKWWDYRPTNRPFIVNFLYAYSFPKRLNLDRLIELQVIKDIGSAPRGFQKITTDQFNAIFKESKSDPSIVID
ncbi:MAG TPA: hypothetical protein VJ385_20660 [Fibrobacteria bacterium]|nr:hypothetical protein [Fibrobacteria bacterium]